MAEIEDQTQIVDLIAPLDPASGGFDDPPDPEQTLQTQEPLKKKKKAPSTDPIPIGVPAAPFKRFYSGSPDRHQYPSQGLKYWNELPSWAKGRIICYVARDWPVLKQITPDEKEKAKEEGKEVEHNYIDKISDPIQDITVLLDRYGSGDYHLTLNDTASGKFGTESRTLCQIYVRENWRDIARHPPTDRRIVDPAQLNMDEKNNAGYIAYLRGMGKLPDTKKDEAQMAEVRTVTQMTDRLLDAALKSNKTPETGSMEKAFEVLASASVKGQEIITESIKKSEELRTNGPDPLESIGRVIDLVDKLKPPPATQSSDSQMVSTFMTGMMEMNKTIIGIQNERIAFAEKIAQESRRESKEPTGEDGTANPGGMKGMLTEFLGMAEILGLKRAGSPSVTAEASKSWLDNLPDILDGVGKLVANGVQIYQTKVYQDMAIMQQRNAAMGMPVQPMPPMPQPPPPPQQQSQELAPTNGNGHGNGDGSQEEEGDMNFITFMGEIRRPLLNHINRGLGGAAFAEWLIDAYDEATYEQIRLQGADTLIMALNSYPPVSKELEGKDLVVKKFVDEFMRMEEIRAAAEAEAEGAGAD